MESNQLKPENPIFVMQQSNNDKKVLSTALSHSYLSRPHRVSRVPENALRFSIAQIDALPRRIEIPGKKFSKKNFVDGDVVDKFSTY